MAMDTKKGRGKQQIDKMKVKEEAQEILFQ